MQRNGVTAVVSARDPPVYYSEPRIHMVTIVERLTRDATGIARTIRRDVSSQFASDDVAITRTSSSIKGVNLWLHQSRFIS